MTFFSDASVTGCFNRWGLFDLADAAGPSPGATIYLLN